MSWNKDLYDYVCANGGHYFGIVEARPGETSAILSYRDRPVLLCAHKESGRGSCHIWGCAVMMAELERPYTLSIRKKNPVERGFGMLSGKDADAVQTEFAQKIRIKSGEDDFTRRVLQSIPLRTVMLEQAGLCLSVRPVEADASLHSVQAKMDWGVEAEDFLTELVVPEEGPLEPAAYLAALLQGVHALYDAVTDYRM